MLPVMTGKIARRILINYRADPEIVARMIPAPLELQTVNGYAMTGICLIRLEELRPSFVPLAVGFSAENVAHRVAVRYPAADGMKPGVFIWRRDTDSRLVAALGGRAFAGVHRTASFEIVDDGGEIELLARTQNAEANVRVHANSAERWQSTPLFETQACASEFLRCGACGFSPGHNRNELEAMTLRTLKWAMSPLEVTRLDSSFYDDETRFPSGSIYFDHALLMRDIPHEWHAGTSLRGHTLAEVAVAGSFAQ